MKTWRVELTTRRGSLAETKIQRGIFPGDALSPLQFIIAKMPLNHILRKSTAGYKLSRSQGKINYLMYMDGIKLFAKNEKELETLKQTVRIYSQDIRMEFGRGKCAMIVRKSGKRHLTDGMELPNQEKIRTLGEKKTYKYLGILEADTIKQVKTQQNSKCRLCNDRDETINHIISECSKLAQKEYKARHDKSVRWSTGKCAGNFNSTIQTNGICTTRHLS